MMEIAKTSREGIGAQAIKMLHAEVERAESIAEELLARIAPVVHQPVPGLTSPDVDEEAWPTYFTEIRSAVTRLRRTVDDLHSALGRLEL